MEIVYDDFLLQILLTGCLILGLLIPAISDFIRPARRTIRASLVSAKTGHIVDIGTAETSIGRSNTCDLILNDETASRFHAVLSYRQKEWMIFDTHSTAGVLLNGSRIDGQASLKDGDRLRFGSTDFVFFSTAVTTREETVKRYRARTSDNTPQYRVNAPQYRVPAQPKQNSQRSPAPRYRQNTTNKKVTRPKK